MTESEPRHTRPQDLRHIPHPDDARDVRWRRAGLAAGGAMVLVIAYATLSPMPMVAAQQPGLDKIAHFLGFALLVFPVILTDSRRWPWAVPLAILFGGGIELVQPSVGRSADWLDWGADISGVLAGAALAELLHDRLRAGLMGRATADPLAGAHPLTEIRHTELIEDLRAVLREELAAIQRPGTEPRPPPPAERPSGDLRH